MTGNYDQLMKTRRNIRLRNEEVQSPSSKQQSFHESRIEWEEFNNIIWKTLLDSAVKVYTNASKTSLENTVTNWEH